MSAELADWLRVQIDEDERVAKSARASWKGGPMLTRHRDASPGDVLRVGIHITEWDTHRVLAEVAAKRALLDLVAEIDYEVSALLARRLLRATAQPYRGRAGWRDEWGTG